MNLTAAERRAAQHLTRPAVPIVLRTWHGVEFTSNQYRGLRGFLLGTCSDNPGLLRVLRTGADMVMCGVPMSMLTGFRTLHGGAACPGDSCTEGAVIELEVAA